MTLKKCVCVCVCVCVEEREGGLDVYVFFILINSLIGRCKWNGAAIVLIQAAVSTS